MKCKRLLQEICGKILSNQLSPERIVGSAFGSFVSTVPETPILLADVLWMSGIQTSEKHFTSCRHRLVSFIKEILVAQKTWDCNATKFYFFFFF